MLSPRQNSRAQPASSSVGVIIPASQLEEHCPIGNFAGNLGGMLLKQPDFVLGQVVLVQICNLAKNLMHEPGKWEAPKLVSKADPDVHPQTTVGPSRYIATWWAADVDCSHRGD